MNIENENPNDSAEQSKESLSRREILKKAGWAVPAIVGVSLINTVSAMSGVYGDDKDKGGKDKGGKGKGGKGKGGKSKGGKGKGGKHQ